MPAAAYQALQGEGAHACGRLALQSVASPCAPHLLCRNRARPL